MLVTNNFIISKKTSKQGNFTICLVSLVNSHFHKFCFLLYMYRLVLSGINKIQQTSTTYTKTETQNKKDLPGLTLIFLRLMTFWRMFRMGMFIVSN